MKCYSNFDSLEKFENSYTFLVWGEKTLHMAKSQFWVIAYVKKILGCECSELELNNLYSKFKILSTIIFQDLFFNFNSLLVRSLRVNNFLGERKDSRKRLDWVFYFFTSMFFVFNSFLEHDTFSYKWNRDNAAYFSNQAKRLLCIVSLPSIQTVSSHVQDIVVLSQGEVSEGTIIPMSRYFNLIFSFVMGINCVTGDIRNNFLED